VIALKDLFRGGFEKSQVKEIDWQIRRASRSKAKEQGIYMVNAFTLQCGTALNLDTNWFIRASIIRSRSQSIE
jgi:hypothetical protein